MGSSPTRDAVLEALRRIADADECVIPALGLLAASKSYQERPRLVRGLSRVLCDLRSRELADLQRIVGAIASFPPEERSWREAIVAATTAAVSELASATPMGNL